MRLKTGSDSATDSDSATENWYHMLCMIKALMTVKREWLNDNYELI